MRRSPGPETVKTVCHRVAATHALPATVSLTIEEFPVFFLASPILTRSLPPRERTGGWGEGAEVGGKCRGWGKVQGLGGRCRGWGEGAEVTIPPFLSSSGGEEGG